MKKYNQKTPPDFDLSLLTMPLAIFSGDTDGLATVKDVAWTVQQLQNSTVVFNKQYQAGHLTFAIGKDMSFLTDDAVPLTNKYNNM